MDDIYNDILWLLRIPLPYELRGLTVQDLIHERKRAADEIERLRTLLSELANRFSAQEAKHYRIIRSLEAERDQWQTQAVRGG